MNESNKRVCDAYQCFSFIVELCLSASPAPVLFAPFEALSFTTEAEATVTVIVEDASQLPARANPAVARGDRQAVCFPCHSPEIRHACGAVMRVTVRQRACASGVWPPK